MKRPMKNAILILSTFFVMTQSMAQGDDDIFEQTKNDALIVAAAGGAGAILGLSTLSFVSKPKDHLKNIVVGGAIGVIIGVAGVAWMQATKSQDAFKQQSASIDYEDSEAFTTAMRNDWHNRNHYELGANLAKDSALALPSVNFQFSF